MKRIIFMACLSLAFVLLLNWISPAQEAEIIIEKEPFDNPAFPEQYRFYDAEVVMRMLGTTLFRDLTHDTGNLFFMFTPSDAEWDSGDIVAIADNRGQLDSNPPIKGGKAVLREKRPGLPKVYYEILTPFIEKDAENDTELIILNYSSAENINWDENWCFFMKLARLLPTDSKGLPTIKLIEGKFEDFEREKQDYEANSAVYYEISTSDVKEDSFGFSIKKYDGVNDLREYSGKARMKNGEWQYKLGLWWNTVEN